MKRNRPTDEEVEAIDSDEDELEIGGWVKPRVPPWVRTVVQGGVVILIAVGLVFWKRQAIRHYANEWSAERHFQKAEDAMASGDFRVALRRALTANDLEPNRIETLRVLLASGRAVEDPRLISLALAVFAHPEAGAADKLEALASLNDAGDGERFAQCHRLLSEAETQFPGVRREWLRSLLVRNRTQELVEAIGEDEIAADWEMARLAWRACVRINQPEFDERAGALAIRLLSEEGVDDRERRALLLEMAQLSPERFSREVANALMPRVGRGSEGETPSLLGWTLRIAAAPATRTSLLARAITEWVEKGRELAPLYRWLHVLQEWERILSLVEVHGPARSPDAYEVQVDALLGLGRFEEALGLLEFPVEGADRIRYLALKARVAGHLERGAIEASAWREALLEAERDLTTNHYLRLFAFAREAGATAVAADALVAACRHPRGLLPPVRELEWALVFLVEENRGADLVTVTDRLLQTEAGNPLLVNNAIYLGILNSGKCDEARLETMRRLVEDFDGVVQMRTTLALAYLAAGRSREAIQTLDPEYRSAFQWQELSSAGRSVFALALAEVGEDAYFRNVYDRIDWDELMKLEQDYFSEAFEPFLEAGTELETEN